MDKKVPFLFDCGLITSPLVQVSESLPNVSEVKIRAFTKFGNRNGSYITEKVADQLIKSAVSQNCPVVGFFDPQSGQWASHTGPEIANGYGFVKDFIGWQPFEDSDGVTRDYAVFSAILHTNYFKEANQILGQNQSMELDQESIQGEWAVIDDNEYFVYSQAEMKGFCVIGSHEPCFSVSAFFSKKENCDSSLQTFSSLLDELKSQIENFEKSKKEEEVQMEDTNQQVETPAVKVQEPTEFELENSKLKQDLEAANATIAALEQEKIDFAAKVESLENDLTAAKSTLSDYENQIEAFTLEKKSTLVGTYEKKIPEAEIVEIKEHISDFSYDELEGRLAIAFSRLHLNDKSEKIPHVTEESEFAKLMKQYKRNIKGE